MPLVLTSDDPDTNSGLRQSPAVHALRSQTQAPLTTPARSCRSRRRDCLGQSASSVADGPKRGACRLQPPTIGLKVVDDQPARCRVEWHVARLAAFAQNLQVRHPAPLVLKVLDDQLVLSQ